jgi:hypothetical protein
MKWLLLNLWLVVTGAQSAEVMATGFGKTVDEALQNAKTAALEQVTGTFVTAQASLEGDRHQSRVDQYNGGLIRTHQVISVAEEDGLFIMLIKADVDTDKVNTVIFSQGAEITESVANELEKARDDFDRTRSIVAALDEPSQAFAVRVTNVRYRNRGYMTDVEVDGEIFYNPKWYDDVRLMARTIGRPVDIGSAWREALWGLAALTAAFNPLITGTAFSIARAAQVKPQVSEEYMACFGKDNGWDVDECYEIRHPMPRTMRSQRFQLAGKLTLADRDVSLGELNVDAGWQMLLNVHIGQRIYFNKNGRERKFYNPGIVLFEKGRATFRHTFSEPTATIGRATGVQFDLLARH